VSGQLHAQAALPPRDKAPGTHWIGGWVGPRAGLDTVVKRKILSLRRESDPDHPPEVSGIFVIILVIQRHICV
jgi:hypothetical protein